MAGSNMQKAGFCISRTSGKCYVSRSNFAPVPWQKPSTFRLKHDSSSSTNPSTKSF